MPNRRRSAGPLAVAIVDDHALVREGIRSVLEQMDDSLVVVYCGDSPADAAAAAPAAALLDMHLGPGAAPVQVNTHTLVSAGVNVVVISAFDDAAAIRTALTAGALGFVPKRAEVEELAQALVSASEGRLHMSAELAAVLARAQEVPELSAREIQALRLYAAGWKLTAVARTLGVSPHTAREYLERVKVKYAEVGRPARTRTELYAAAASDGLIDADTAGASPGC